MTKIVSILTTLIVLMGCAGKQIHLEEPKMRWPQRQPPWLAGDLRDNQFRGVSQPTSTEQDAFRDAYRHAIEQIAKELGTQVEGQEEARFAIERQVYNSQIVAELKTTFRRKVQSAHTVENYMEFRGGKYKVYLLIECDLEQLRSAIAYANQIRQRLPKKDRSALNHALRQLMYTLIVDAQAWTEKLVVRIEVEPNELHDTIQSAIVKTKVFDVYEGRGTDVIVKIKCNQDGDSWIVSMRIVRVAEKIIWGNNARGFSDRDWPLDTVPFNYPNRLLTAAHLVGQVGLGYLLWDANNDYNDRAENYENLRGKPRSELKMEKKAVEDLHDQRVTLGWGFGLALGMPWIYSTISNLIKTSQYKKQRQLFELELSDPNLSTIHLEPMHGGFRLTHRF